MPLSQGQLSGDVIMFPKPFFITLLLVSTATLMSVQAFKIVFTSSITHQNITKTAILEKTADTCRNYALQHGSNFVKPNPLTVESLAEACGSSSSASTLKWVLTEVAIRNAFVDAKHVPDPEYHFDDESFVKARNLITAGVSLVKASVQQKNYEQARQRLGETLHTLQDFYSHSNWIELGNESPYTNLIKPSLPLDNIADKSTPTCSSCDTDCSNNILPSIISQKKLTSGYFSVSNKDKPNGKCSHGGSLDRTSRVEPKGGINKDDDTSSHGSLHTKAASVAIAATIELLQDIREASGDKEFLRLMGISPTSTVLCFVIDTTVSMADDISEVKRVTSFIIDSRRGTVDEPSDYILVTFNDPDFGPLTKTSDPELFKAKVNALSASGGGDDPEMSLSGLWLALAGTPSASEIFLFTDAEAKDTEMKSTVLALIESTKSMVNFMLTNPLTNTTRSLTNPVNQMYEDLALASGGLAIEVSKELLANASTIVTDLSLSALVTIFQVERNPGRSEVFSFLIDFSVKNLTIYLTGNVTGFFIINPSGLYQVSNQIDGDLGLIKTVGNFHTVQIKQASNKAGQWLLNINSAQPYTVKVVGQSAVDFRFDFIEVSELGDTSYLVLKSRPPADGNVTLLITMLGTGLEKPTEVALVKTSDLTVYPGTLGPLNDNWMVTVSTVPTGEFFIRVIGQTNSSSTSAGNIFQRQSSTRYRVSNITVNATSSGVWSPGETFSLPFNVLMKGNKGTYTITARNNLLYNMTYPSILAAGTDGGASGLVNITAPVNASAGTAVILTIEATVPGQNDSNYAVLRLAVGGAVAPPAVLCLSLLLSAVALFVSALITK